MPDPPAPRPALHPEIVLRWSGAPAVVLRPVPRPS